MALTESRMMALGTRAPDFKLTDARNGETVALQDAKGPAGTLVAFICNHCPYVVHVVDAFAQLANSYQKGNQNLDHQGKSINTIAICSNDIDAYPEDGPEAMRVFAQDHGFDFPYLFDATQEVAKSYQAACTPDFYLFDADLKCVYRGQMDGARPGNKVENDGADLRAAMDALLAGEAISEQQRPSAGCNIKWK